MENFTPVASLIGGLLIGLSAVFVLLAHGRIAGISGIVDGVLTPRAAPDELGWRLPFVAGLMLTGLVGLLLAPASFEFGLERSTASVIVAGLLVGLGTRIGGGCTSGHGVCGVGRLSRRSIVATLTFVGTGGLVAAVVTHGFGGSI